MNKEFDELAKGMAQSVTRRGALKKFGLGVAGIALASLGLANKAEAHPRDCDLHCSTKCKKKTGDQYAACYDSCIRVCCRWCF